jgi:hypothetical protein
MLAPAPDQPHKWGRTPTDHARNRTPAAHVRAFLAWMQAMGFEGRYVLEGPSGLKAFYLWWCHDEAQRPLIDNVWLAHLRTLVETSTTRVKLDDGTPRRLAVYVIPPLPEEREAEPEPMRRAA